MSPAARKQLGYVLTAIFVVAMLLGPGPGLLLVNDADWSLMGLPIIYAWGIVWYFVQVAVVVAAYLFVWRDPESDV